MFTYPAPVDGAYDYFRRPPEWVDIGSEVFVVATITGVVTSIDVTGDPVTDWAWFMDAASAGGLTADGAYITLPDDATAQPAQWWARHQILNAEPMGAPGSQFTQGDGSAWITGVDGRIMCTIAGTTYTRGQRMYRGELQLLPGDLYNPPDRWAYTDTVGVEADQLDWIPYPAAGIGPGQYVSWFGLYGAGVVDEILVQDFPTHTRREWRVSGQPVGWQDFPAADTTPVPGHRFTVFERRAVPAVDSKWRAGDGSLWVHLGSGEYFCWADGSRYSATAVSARGDIVGGLTEIV